MFCTTPLLAGNQIALVLLCCVNDVRCLLHSPRALACSDLRDINVRSLCMVKTRTWWSQINVAQKQAWPCEYAALPHTCAHQLALGSGLGLTQCWTSHGQLPQPPRVCCVWRDHYGCGAHEIQRGPHEGVQNVSITEQQLSTSMDDSPCDRPIVKGALTAIVWRPWVLMRLCSQPTRSGAVRNVASWCWVLWHNWPSMPSLS